MMKLKQMAPRKKALSAFVLMTTLLYISFYNDPLGIAPQGSPETRLMTRTHDLLPRFIENRQQGFFSKGGHQLYDWVPDSETMSARKKNHLETYLRNKDEPLPNYPVKTSHRCLQCFFYGGIELGLRKLAIEPAQRLKMMHRGTALLTGAVLAALLVLIAAEFGVGGALFALLFIAGSKYFIIYAPNLYWMPFLWFAQILWCWFYYIYHPPPSSRKALGIFSLGFFIFTLLNCLRGYEFMSSVLISCGAIVVYGLSKDGFRWREIFRQGGLLVANGLAAFAAAVVIHITTSVTGAGASIFLRAKSTTYFNPFEKTSVGEVLMEQVLFDKMLSLPGFSVGPYILYLFALLVLLLLFVYSKAVPTPTAARQNPLALTLFALLSLFASTSWHLLAKSHTYPLPSWRWYGNDVVWYLSAAIIMPPVLWALGRMVFENWNRKNDEA